jgi:hypothetical protein
LTLVPVAQGIAASVIAFLMVVSWIAIGSLFLDDRLTGDEVSAPAAILIGSAITSFGLALAAAAGFVEAGTISIGVLCLVTVMRRRRTVASYLASIVTPYRAESHRRWAALALVIAAAAIWITAISPPRNADAMRYHLAHVRQILQDGRWERIADYHYALPFGWSLSYLPFEMLHLPQGSQLLGLALSVVFVSAVVRVAGRYRVSDAAMLASMLLVFHPAVLRVFSEPSADAYALFVILVTVLLLLRVDHLSSRDALLLGFASFIGLQSRYQLGAAAVAASIVFIVAIRGRPGAKGALIAFLGGASGALVLASPFYIANEVRFHNTVWPLFIDLKAAGASYADTVAYTYSKSLTGSYAPQAAAHAILDLIRTPYVFPLAIVIPAIIAAACVRQNSRARAAGWFGLIFLAEWWLIQPLLYPRFILLMVPVAVLCAALILDAIIGNRKAVQSFIATGSVIAAAGLALTFAFISRDSFRFAVSGNEASYHRYTWFYGVYSWANSHTRPDARFLVIVSSGHSYYLDRAYRRADPWLSGEVDWPHVNGGAGLDSVLARGGYSYVIFENRDWSVYPGGSEAQDAVRDALHNGLLRRVALFDCALYTSRFRGEFRRTKVYVFERSTPARQDSHLSRGAIVLSNGNANSQSSQRNADNRLGPVYGCVSRL